MQSEHVVSQTRKSCTLLRYQVPMAREMTDTITNNVGICKSKYIGRSGVIDPL